MLKCITGAVVGWSAARLLPPPNPNERLKPPTSEELFIIVQKTQDYFIQIQKYLDKLDKEK